MEIELKLACEPNALELFEDKVIPKLEALEISISKNKARLYNEYYDTAEQVFGKREMGFRVRSRDDQYEQTIKTKGKVSGGLHQRPEYNVKIDSAVPDLHKFPSDIWEQDFDISGLNEQLQSLFSTHFERTTFEISHKDYKMEVVFDVGEVKRDQDSLPICEIELELIDGDVTHLYAVAEHIIQLVPSRLSNLTKAARGYQLLQGNAPEATRLPQFLKLDKDETTEDAFCKALQAALHHWQYHQQIYTQSGNLKALYQIRESLLLLLQTVALYLPVLQCDELLNLHKQLLRLNRSWAWQEQLECIHQLRSKKGPFSRRIPKNQNLMNYLMGRREGLINAHQPDTINMSAQSTGVQIQASKLVLTKPWQQQNSGAEIAVKKHAHGWLSQTWQTVLQSLPNNSSMDDKQYLSIEVLLRQSLINGFLLADLFADSRGQFRAPWQDLATGIKELKALALLHEAINDLNLDDKIDFQNWLQDKTHSVIKVMEQSREVAMEADTYW